MKLTNKQFLPEAILQAIKNDGYTKGDADFSVTELLKPSRLRALSIKHKDQITEDVSDRLWSLYGQVAHGVLERSNTNDLVEQRFFADFDGYTLSGQIDTLELKDNILSDYKFTTSWGFKSNTEAKPEWVAQLNMQLELLRQNGKDAKKLQIIGLLRDWQTSQAKKDPTYPQCPIMILPIPIWPREKTQAFIKERIKSHVEAMESLPVCSNEEMWAGDEKWAVMKKGQKRALKLYDDEDKARVHASQNLNFYVEYRQPVFRRCADYCPVSQFCSQYQSLVNQNKEESA